MISKLIPGGEVRFVKRGDESTYKGEKKTAGKDYVMIKLVSMKSPMFLDETAYRLIVRLVDDDDFRRMYVGWLKV